MFEPLLIAFVFPFVSHRPWQLKRAPGFLGVGGAMRNLWQESKIPVRFVLRQLWLQQREMATMSQSMVQKVLLTSHKFGVLHSSRTEQVWFGLATSPPSDGGEVSEGH